MSVVKVDFNDLAPGAIISEGVIYVGKKGGSKPIVMTLKPFVINDNLSEADVFVNRLNGFPNGYGGYRNWRLPDKKDIELLLRLADQPGPVQDFLGVTDPYTGNNSSGEHKALYAGYVAGGSSDYWGGTEGGVTYYSVDQCNWAQSQFSRIQSKVKMAVFACAQAD